MINDSFSIHLFDMNGKKHQAMEDVTGGNVQLDISDLPSGVYVVKAITGDRQYFAKLAIQ